MAKFRIIEQREIVKGYFYQTYLIEAENIEEAKSKLSDIEFDDADIEEEDQGFDIRESNLLDYTDEFGNELK